MRALVVYESMYGNTHVIASNIADGLRATHEVTLVPVATATADLVAQADLLVVPAESFLVSQENLVVDGETSRARRWGAALGAAAAIAHVPAAA